MWLCYMHLVMKYMRMQNSAQHFQYHGNTEEDISQAFEAARAQAMRASLEGKNPFMVPGSVELDQPTKKQRTGSTTGQVLTMTMEVIGYDVTPSTEQVGVARNRPCLGLQCLQLRCYERVIIWDLLIQIGFAFWLA